MKKFLALLLIVIVGITFSGCNRDLINDWSDIYEIGMDNDFESCSGVEEGNGDIAHVIILTGQSNCTGCSITSYLKEKVTEEDFTRYQNGYSNVLINFNIDNHRTCSEGEFRKTDLLCGSYDEEFGPEVGLADKLNKTFPDEKFFILKFSMSGYSLNYHWMKNYERGEIYNSTILFAKNSLNYLVSLNYKVSLDAVLFMQGESDTTEYKTNRYYRNLSNYVSFLREDLAEYTSENGLYFIDAGISDSPYNLPTYEQLNSIKEKFSKESDLNRYFSTIDNGLTTMYEPYYEPDLGHYDALSEIRLGELYAEELIDIYTKNWEK
ncbi:MAG: sialate O-acetylesterase [Candidatus Caccovivens sp.]